MAIDSPLPARAPSISESACIQKEALVGDSKRDAHISVESASRCRPGVLNARVGD
jgi:hypothetical protein